MFKIYSETDKLGTIFWYIECTFIHHREDGPAIEWHDGAKWWYQNGLCHRIDGPAVKYSNGYKEYWLNGIYYENIKTDEEWIIFQIIN